MNENPLEDRELDVNHALDLKKIPSNERWTSTYAKPLKRPIHLPDKYISSYSLLLLFID